MALFALITEHEWQVGGVASSSKSGANGGFEKYCWGERAEAQGSGRDVAGHACDALADGRLGPEPGGTVQNRGRVAFGD